MNILSMKRKLPNVISEPSLHENIFDGLDVSETTRKEYSARIGLFLSYVHARGFNEKSYLAFKRYLEGRGDYSVSTKNKYLTTARVFLRELQRKGKLPFDVTYSVKHFRQSKRHKREGLSDKEVRLMGVKIQSLPNTPRNSPIRDKYSFRVVSDTSKPSKIVSYADGSLITLGSFCFIFIFNMHDRCTSFLK